MDHGSPPPSRPTAGSGAGPNLVFGLIALQNGLIDRETLRAAFRSWVADRSLTIGRILVDRGALDPENHALIESLARDHLNSHGGDARTSLTGLGLDGDDAIRSTFDLIDDADLRTILSGFGPEVDSGEATAHWHPDVEPTSEGQRYRKIAKYKEGGLGVVFRGRDEELHRDVAVKEIREARADDPSSRARLILEAEITGRLEHPGIVSVYSKGTTARGRPYYVMRFIRGREFKAAIAEFHATDWSSRSPGSRAVALRGLLSRFVAACNTIAYAHSRKVIHRDIKPANILLGPFGETLVIDWGLAKPVDDVGEITVAETTIRPTASGESHPTRDGSVMGTVRYMSPEQAVGDLPRVGPSSDIFLLGATLYELLTGGPPYNDKDQGVALARARDWSFARPREVVASIPEALEAICLKAMARSPEDRYPGAIALARDVDRWLADEPVTALPEPPSARLARWGRHHRAWVLAAAAALVLVSAVSIASALVVDRARRGALAARDDARAAKAEADLQRDRALADFRRAIDADLEILTLAETVLGSVPRMEAQWAALAQKSLNAFVGFLDRAPDDAQLLHATVRSYRLVGNIRRGAIQFNDAEASYQKAISLLEGRRTRSPADRLARDRLVELYNEMGDTKRFRGRPGEGEPFVVKASEIARGLRDEFPEHPDYKRTEARCRYNLAGILKAIGRSHEAVDLYESAVATLTPAAEVANGEVARIELGMVLCDKGEALRNDRRMADSEESLRRSIEVIRPLLATYIARDARFLQAAARIELGLTLAQDPARRQEAEAAFGLAIEGLRELRLQFPSHADYRKSLACAYQGLAAIRLDAGRAQDAEADLKRSEAIFAGLFRDFPGMVEYEAHFARTLRLQGQAARARGDRPEAIRRFQQAEARFRAALDANPASRPDGEAIDAIRADLKGLGP